MDDCNRSEDHSPGGSMIQLSATAPGKTATVMWKKGAAVIGVAVAALLVIGGPAHALGGWTAVPSPNELPGNNYLYGADSSDASNVWAVGAFTPPLGGGSHGQVLRYDGTAWRSVA